MKKNKTNYVDSLVENLAANFSKVKNFHLLQESEEGKRLFNLIVKSHSEIETFQSLFISYFIPAANKSIVDSWNQINKSLYKKTLNISKDDLKENLFEIIRLGYVGLFHKYEAYLKDLIGVVNFVMKEVNEENSLLSVQDYCKSKYDIDIFKSHHNFKITKRINFIANCIKHYDGYPLKKPIHEDFINADLTNKLKISPEQFKHDISLLKIHLELLMSLIMTLSFEQFFNLSFESIKGSMSSEYQDERLAMIKINEMQRNFDLILSDFKK